MNKLMSGLVVLSSASLAVIVDAILKGVLLLALAFVVVLLMRKASAAGRHLVWLLAVVSLLLLPVLSGVLPGWRVLPQWRTLDFPTTPQPAVSAVPPLHPDPEELPAIRLSPERAENSNSLGSSPNAPWQSEPAEGTVTESLLPAKPIGEETIRWGPMVMGVWLAGLLVALVPVGLGAASLWRIRRRTCPVTDGCWLKRIEELSIKIGLRRPVRLLLSSERVMPMVWGHLHPKLLMPERAEKWSEDRLRVVLLHELAHVKRRDCLTNALTRLVCALYWFNPLVWVVAWRMRVEREHACDDIVIRTGANAPDYAEELLQLATGLKISRWAPGNALAITRKSTLEGRLLAIVDQGRNRRGLTRVSLCVGLALVAMTVVPIAMLQGQNDGRGRSFVADQPAAGEDKTVWAVGNPVEDEIVADHPTLTVQAKIAGVVRDPDGLPLGGVEIDLCPNFPDTVQSKSDGTFEIVWNDDGFYGEDAVFYIFARDKGRDMGLALPVSKASTPLDLVLKPAVTLVGRVVDDNGKGIANAKLHPMLRASTWNSSFGGDYRNPLRTDANGFYEIKSLPPDNRYSLTAWAQGYGETRVDLVDTREAVNKRLDVEVMTLATANLRVSGQVVDDEGRPVAKARVDTSRSGEGQPNVNATTDAQGQFVLDGLCEGDVYVWVSSAGKEDLLGHATVEAGASNIKLVVGEGRPAHRYIRSKTYDETLATEQFVAGQAVDESGLPVAGVPVNVTAILREREEGKFTRTYSTYNRLGDVTDDQGRFIIKVDEDAAYCLLFSPKRQAAIIQYDVPMKTKDLQVTLPQGGTVSGRLVRIQNGRKVPIPNVEVKIERTRTRLGSFSDLGSDQDRTTKTDENGGFRFKHLRTVYRSGKNKGTYDARTWELSYGDLKQTLGFYDNQKTLDVELVITP